MMKDFKKIAQALNISFQNFDLLKEALTHRSFLNEHKDWDIPHNERLEFLGDSILGFVVADNLVKQYPQFTEGELTSLRAALVNSDSLLAVAKELKLEDYLLVSHGEARELKNSRSYFERSEKQGSLERSERGSYLLANAIEALIGALYLDGGIEKAKDFIQKYILSKAETILQTASYKDAKSLFQEKSQELLGITPTYKGLQSWGPDHAKQFEVGVYLNEDLISQGKGYSKQEAEINAAQEALKAKGWQ